MWHSLQELDGIHNSHAERLLAQERKAQTALPIKSEETTIAPAISEPEVSTSELIDSESHGDEPFIESARCTNCNECIQINGKMFAYNENKQAYIVDVDAGTFRQLVEAAEGCQVSIIHPGKPRNPKEPGMDDLIRRASQFN
jgi:ferredoxin